MVAQREGADDVDIEPEVEGAWRRGAAEAQGLPEEATTATGPPLPMWMRHAAGEVY